MKIKKIPFLSLSYFYNLYFIIVVKKTFNTCLKNDYKILDEIGGDLSKQINLQKNLCKESIDLASSYPEFASINLRDNDGKQNIYSPVNKDFFRKNTWTSRQGLWKKSSNTSGSSGKSFKIIRSPKAFVNSQITFYHFFLQFNINRFDRNIYVGGARQANSSLVKKIGNYIFSKITGTQKFVATDMVSDEHYKNFIKTYEQVKPIYLQGFSSALLRIANYIEQKNICLKWAPKLVHPSAEHLSISQRNILERVFRSPVAMVYGAAECHMASECEYGLMHINMTTCDLKTKDDGTAVLTVFNTDTMPLVNYEMGDLLELENPKSPCKCGRHTTIISNIIGRQSDKIVLPSNRVLTHPDLNMLIEQLDPEKGIREYQIIHYLGSPKVEIRFIAKSDFDFLTFNTLLNNRFSDVDFYTSSKPFSLLKNGKKPLILTVNNVPLLRRTYDTYEPYIEISDSQEKQNENSLLKLDWNESTSDFPKHLKLQALDELSGIPLNLYPDLQTAKLKVAIGKWLQINPDSLSVFNGSDAGIATICRLFLEETDTVVTIEPTYGNYRAIASRYTKNVKSYQLDFPFIIDFEKLSNFLQDEAPKILFLTNPNNPTGVEYTREAIFEFSERFPKICIVIDEAYVEFGDNSLLIDGIPTNVIVLRTFSKAFGLAGIRLGYSITDRELALKIALSKDNKEVDVFAQIVGRIAVKNPEYMYAYLEAVKKGREVLLNFFNVQKIPYIAGKGNFVLFSVENPFDVELSLKKENIFVRNRTKIKNLEGYLRVTLGDESAMNEFILILKKIL